MKVVQIGAGLVGQLIATDLNQDFEVTVIDRNEQTLDELRKKLPGIKTAVASGTDPEELAPVLADADIVTAGVPGKYGYEMMKSVISLGKDLVDISFMPEDFEDLDDMAKEKGVTVIPDMGVAPGMSNFLMGRGCALLDETEDAYIYVGGIPANPQPPFNYTATWSPRDCIEEFTRPVTIIRDGKKVVLEATEGLHLREFPTLGTLEVFYTDGLRSLARNLKARNMGEMTMRWPGHVEQMRLLRTMGMFDEEPRMLGGQEVIPMDVTADLLFPLWKMEPEKGDRDLTIMKVEVKGIKGRDEVTYTWDLLDYFDKETWNTSMSRCTGLSCAIFARALLKGLIEQKGVLPAEKLAGDHELYSFIMQEQKRRRINYVETVKVVKNIR
ncbi:MAG: saccharopine dehydrogenase NADP-binding domain-containing protein [Synergistales bacterium]|nr:saccharopine dehydrogenase NADP-binding domain-containing protein [Synergistales bacterium]